MERREGCRGGDERGCSIVAITMSTPAGDVTMESCSACDQRWWTMGGERTDREAALAGLSSTRRR